MEKPFTTVSIWVKVKFYFSLKNGKKNILQKIKVDLVKKYILQQLNQMDWIYLEHFLQYKLRFLNFLIYFNNISPGLIEVLNKQKCLRLSDYITYLDTKNVNLVLLNSFLFGNVVFKITLLLCNPDKQFMLKMFCY